MIAHVLSKLSKEKRFYENFIAMNRRFGYSKSTILDFKKEVHEYWDNSVKDEDEDGNKDHGEEAYATYGSKTSHSKGKEHQKLEAKMEPHKQHFQSGKSEHKASQLIWTSTGPMMMPIGIMSPGQDSTIIQDHMQELIIMQSKPMEAEKSGAASIQASMLMCLWRCCRS